MPWIISGISVLAVAVIAIFIVLIALSYAAFDFLLLVPRQSPDELKDILTKKKVFPDDIADEEFERINLTSFDGLNLAGYYLNRFAESKKAVIIAHGYTSNHVYSMQYAPLFLQRGYNVLLFDQRAHCESEGKYPSYGLFESQDLKLWVDWLRKRLGEGCEIGLMGHSIGGATVLSLPKYDNDIKFIVADSAFTSLYRFVYARFKFLHLPFKPFAPFINGLLKRKCGYSINEPCAKDVVAGAGHDIPIMFVHGTKDITVPCGCSTELYEAHDNPKDVLYIVPNAAHPDAYADNPERYKKTLYAFLDSLD